MKSIMLSIKPKYCELIASGKKTIEVRKTKPRLTTPFKCYIYCTMDNAGINPKNYLWKKDMSGRLREIYWNGKVIGEFICDGITPYESEFVDDECYEQINKLIGYDDFGDEQWINLWNNEEDEPYEKTSFYKSSRVSYQDLKKYIGLGFQDFYAWNISKLKIYDKPKELSEFKKINRDCWCADLELAKRNCLECRNVECFLTRPPQSWCYVEEVI